MVHRDSRNEEYTSVAMLARIQFARMDNAVFRSTAKYIHKLTATKGDTKVVKVSISSIHFVT